VKALVYNFMQREFADLGKTGFSTPQKAHNVPFYCARNARCLVSQKNLWHKVAAWKF
jgi:hypothetical protein